MSLSLLIVGTLVVGIALLLMAGLRAVTPDTRRTLVTRTINAPVEKVFLTVANPGEFAKALPHVVKVEFLTQATSGVGTRFRETRRKKDTESNHVLRVTDFVENKESEPRL